MLVTPRLLLRRWRNEDLEPFSALCADLEVMRWIGNGTPRSPAQCAESISAYERQWEANGFGLFATELRETGDFVGSVGLSIPEFLPEILPAVEVGWRLGRSHWGQGLATEAARAALDFGFEDLGLDRIVSIHQVGNHASARVMVKLGIALERETVHPGVGRPLHVHAITAGRYRRDRQNERRSDEDDRRAGSVLRSADEAGGSLAGSARRAFADAERTLR